MKSTDLALAHLMATGQGLLSEQVFRELLLCARLSRKHGDSGCHTSTMAGLTFRHRLGRSEQGGREKASEMTTTQHLSGGVRKLGERQRSHKLGQEWRTLVSFSVITGGSL